MKYRVHNVPNDTTLRIEPRVLHTRSWHSDLGRHPRKGRREEDSYGYQLGRCVRAKVDVEGIALSVDRLERMDEKT